jgi:hypothetical protein
MKTLADFGLTAEIVSHFVVNATPPARTYYRGHPVLTPEEKRRRQILRVRVQNRQRRLAFKAAGLTANGTPFKNNSIKP